MSTAFIFRFIIPPTPFYKGGLRGIAKGEREGDLHLIA